MSSESDSETIFESKSSLFSAINRPLPQWSCQEYVQWISHWLRLERDYAVSQSSLEGVSLKQLRINGQALGPLQVASQATAATGHLHWIMTSMQTGPLAAHGFRQGDPVRLVQKSNRSDGIDATIYRIQNDSLTVTLDSKLEQDLDLNSSYHLVQQPNHISFKRMKKALSFIEQHPLCPTAFEFQKPNVSSSFEEITFFNPNLDASQQEAVRFALSTPHWMCLFGPPGTGKTMTLIELIRQCCRQGKRLLVCAPSHVAVDNILERLSACPDKLKLVRLGHASRVHDNLLSYVLDAQIQSSDAAQLVQDARKDLEKLQQTLFGKKDKRGSKKMTSDERRANLIELKELRRDIKQRSKTLADQILSSANVVLSTLCGSAMLRHLMKDQKPLFDFCIIDEATQAVEPECWIALDACKAKKCILAGDPFQLPPTVLCPEAGGLPPSDATRSVSENLAFTLVDRLRLLYSPLSTLQRPLTVQYRMHQSIMHWSASYFYENELKAHESCAQRLLCQLPGVIETDDTRHAIVWLDTTGAGFDESVGVDDNDDGNNNAVNNQSNLNESSKCNVGEAETLIKHVKRLLAANVSPTDMAVITPYNAQVQLLKRLLFPISPLIECGSVDGFQGREKEAILLSLVRSNPDSEVGFLRDMRRLNVAVTRPRRHLCIVCDTQTLSEKCVPLKEWIEMVQELPFVDVRYVAHESYDTE